MYTFSVVILIVYLIGHAGLLVALAWFSDPPMTTDSEAVFYVRCIVGVIALGNTAASLALCGLLG